jgi:hypothetical protein
MLLPHHLGFGLCSTDAKLAESKLPSRHKMIKHSKIASGKFNDVVPCSGSKPTLQWSQREFSTSSSIDSKSSSNSTRRSSDFSTQSPKSRSPPRLGLLLDALPLAYNRPGSLNRPYSAHLMPLEHWNPCQMFSRTDPQTVTNLGTARMSPCHKRVTSCSLTSRRDVFNPAASPSFDLLYFSLSKL